MEYFHYLPCQRNQDICGRKAVLRKEPEDEETGKKDGNNNSSI